MHTNKLTYRNQKRQPNAQQLKHTAVQNKQTDSDRYRQTQRQERDRPTDRETDTQTERQTHRQRDRQRDSETDTQTVSHLPTMNTISNFATYIDTFSLTALQVNKPASSPFTDSTVSVEMT